MSILKICLLSITTVFIVGCSAPKPAKLSNSANIYLNKNILAPKKEAVIPKNKHELKSKNWTHTFFTKKDNERYFNENTEIKIKYLAAHSSLITIKGDEDILKDYVHYFKNIVGIKSRIDVVSSDEQPDEIITVTFTKNRKELK
ncbi:MAG: hypothetical protein LBG21_03875 [Campylobacteraceae bacterium]|jgi:uncharacterized lipoprotein YehR (DUF1307 family)|nr:hypothetical protein [Campylobacteraceae bacterium]